MNNSNSSFDRYANLKKNFAPAHKSGTTCQIVNDVPEHKTLSDYIRSVRRAEAFDAVAAEKKLTFDEWINNQWWASDGPTKSIARLTWKAAQENK